MWFHGISYPSLRLWYPHFSSITGHHLPNCRHVIFFIFDIFNLLMEVSFSFFLDNHIEVGLILNSFHDTIRVGATNCRIQNPSLLPFSSHSSRSKRKQVYGDLYYRCKTQITLSRCFYMLTEIFKLYKIFKMASFQHGSKLGIQ